MLSAIGLVLFYQRKNMSKRTNKVVFKPYAPAQIQLLPPSLDELISPTHLVRVVNEVVDQMDLRQLIADNYEGGGTSSYHPSMMVKVILYSYAMKIYTGRKIAKALRQDVTFMWIAASNRPDFRTINGFRTGILKDTIESLFSKLVQFLIEQGYVTMENYFCDGTTIAADGNKNKIVWNKSTHRYKQLAEEKCKELFNQIDQLNTEEQKAYGDKDLEELGDKGIDKKSIRDQVNKLNETIEQTEDKRKLRKANSLKKKLEEQEIKINKYQRRIETADGRSGYNRTDTDASAMYMKNEEILPAYNILAGSENQFITGFSIHQNPNDGTCFKQHIEELGKTAPFLPESITADSIFGTEENYELLENKKIGNYLKFKSFHSEQKRGNVKDKFHKDRFIYDEESDTYTCPNEQKLTYQSSRIITYKKTKYISELKTYKCANCAGCPFAAQCIKSNEIYRIIETNEKLEKYKNQARSNLNSEEGINRRKRRGCEIESCWGDIKQNMNFRRFHVRGKQKVKTEFGIIALAHNLRKIHLERTKNVA